MAAKQRRTTTPPFSTGECRNWPGTWGARWSRAERTGACYAASAPFTKCGTATRPRGWNPEDIPTEGAICLAARYVQVGVKDAPVRAACGIVSTTGADDNGLTHSITAWNGKFAMNAGTGQTPLWPPASTARSPPAPATSSAEKPTGPVGSCGPEPLKKPRR